MFKKNYTSDFLCQIKICLLQMKKIVKIWDFLKKNSKIFQIIKKKSHNQCFSRIKGFLQNWLFQAICLQLIWIIFQIISAARFKIKYITIYCKTVN